MKITKFLAAVVCAANITAFCVMGSPPASALTPNEKFVTHVFEDFLRRQPASNEVLFWTTFLGGGGSRVAVLDSVMGTTEFRTNWVHGVYFQYLRRTATSSELSSALSALSGGNYLGTEVTALASTEFFVARDSDNVVFVEALYPLLLDREADAGGLSYWVGRLNNGESRSTIVGAFARTSDAAGRRVRGIGVGVTCPSTTVTSPADIDAGSYCLVLKRPADASGASYWTGILTGTGQLPALWRSLASSTEYFNRP